MSTLYIADKYEQNMLVGFDAIAKAEPIDKYASILSWVIEFADGSLRPDSGLSMAALEPIMTESRHSPMNWTELKKFANTFFQLYDCRFVGKELTTKRMSIEKDPAMIIECIDSGVWKIVAPDPIVTASAGMFKSAHVSHEL